MFGYTLCGLGFSLIKLSHMKRQQRSTKQSYSRLLCISGYIINSLGGFLNTMGLRYSAQSLIAALSSWAILSNTVFGIYILGERLYLHDIVPMCLIMIGNLLTVFNANHSEQTNLTLDQIHHLFNRSIFHHYLIAIMLLSTMILIVRYRIMRKIKQSGGKQYAHPNLVNYEGLCITCIATMCCVNSVFLSKVTVLSVFTNRLELKELVTTPFFITLVITWLGLTTSWIGTLNYLLSAHDVLFIVPCIEVLWSICSMIGGGIVFDEFTSMTTSNRVLFTLGVAVNIAGVLVLSRRSGHKASKLG